MSACTGCCCCSQHDLKKGLCRYPATEQHMSCRQQLESGYVTTCRRCSRCTCKCVTDCGWPLCCTAHVAAAPAARQAALSCYWQEASAAAAPAWTLRCHFPADACSRSSCKAQRGCLSAGMLPTKTGCCCRLCAWQSRWDAEAALIFLLEYCSRLHVRPKHC